MPLFDRRPAVPSAPPRDPDRVLPFFDTWAADRFRALVARTWAERGHEMTVHPDHLSDAQGRTFGLWNLAVACRPEPERKWKRLVAEHVDKMLTVVDRPSHFAGLTEEQAARQAFLRLAEAANLPGPWYGYAPEVVPGVVELIALDLPDAVACFADKDVEALGGHEALRRAGLANLRGVLAEAEHRELRLQHGARVDVLVGESFYTASLALLLPEVLEAVHPGSSDAPFGVFVAMPNRTTLAVHVLRDSSAVASLNAMAVLAASGYDDGAGALSPYLYWWHDGRWQQVSTRSVGSIEVELGDELEDALMEAVDTEA